jgi:hypothetical protein
MKYQLYKPNSKNSGCAMGFSIGKGKDGSPSLFISAVLQSSWNDKTKTGSFAANAKDSNKSGNFKMNSNEAGEILSSIKTRIPVVFFHKFNEDTTIIKLAPWDKDRKVKSQNGEEVFKIPAFGISISKNSSQNFKIALEPGEVEILAVLLTEFIKQDLEFQKGKIQQEPAIQQNQTKPKAQVQEIDSFEDDAPF